MLLKLDEKFVKIKRVAKTGDKTQLLLALLLEDLLEENKVLFKFTVADLLPISTGCIYNLPKNNACKKLDAPLSQGA